MSLTHARLLQHLVQDVPKLLIFIPLTTREGLLFLCPVPNSKHLLLLSFLVFLEERTHQTLLLKAFSILQIKRGVNKRQHVITHGQLMKTGGPDG